MFRVCALFFVVVCVVFLGGGEEFLQRSTKKHSPLKSQRTDQSRHVLGDVDLRRRAVSGGDVGRHGRPGGLECVQQGGRAAAAALKTARARRESGGGVKCGDRWHIVRDRAPDSTRGEGQEQGLFNRPLAACDWLACGKRVGSFLRDAQPRSTRRVAPPSHARHADLRCLVGKICMQLKRRRSGTRATGPHLLAVRGAHAEAAMRERLHRKRVGWLLAGHTLWRSEKQGGGGERL